MPVTARNSTQHDHGGNGSGHGEHRKARADQIRTTTLPLSATPREDPGVQPREACDLGTVEREGVAFTPVDVFGTDHTVSDGNQRLAAARTSAALLELEPVGAGTVGARGRLTPVTPVTPVLGMVG